MINIVSSPRPEERKRVLVIDDEKGFTDILKQNLEQFGNYDVRCENDSGRALRTARHFRPDIVFLDIVMPGLDGGEIAGQLHDDPELRKVPVVFVTALLDSRETKGGAITNRKGEEMMGKPVRLEAVCECLERYLG